MSLGGILKAAVPLAATAFGGPVAGAAAGALFGGGKGGGAGGLGGMLGGLLGGAGAKGGAEGIGALTSLFAGGAKPLGMNGMQPDIAKLALSLFKDATTPEQKGKLLDVAIAALGGDPVGKAGGMTAMSSPNSAITPPANDAGQPPAANRAHSPAGGKTAKSAAAGGEKVTYERGADGSTKITYEKPGSSTKADSASKADSTGKAAVAASSTGKDAALSVTGNTVDTGRYQVSADTKDGGTVKVFDKQTNTFVKAFGDPHVETSDGDKAQFQKNGLSIKLPDGTNVHMKPTEPGKDGKSYIDSAMVEKDGKSVTMDGLHDGAIKTSQPKTTTDDMVQDYTTQGQTVLDASDQDVGDLFMTGPDGQRTKELVSPDKETNLDGMGGALNTKDGEATTAAGEAKGKSFAVNNELMDKLSQVLHLTARNVPDQDTQQDLLKNIQEVLSSFLKPVMDDAA